MTTAIVLAAGQGQRLKPLTSDRPKGMVDVGGQTIIERQRRAFERLGIDRVAIVKGFCARSVLDYSAAHYVNEEYDTTNMVYSLFCAEEEFVSADSVIVSYGDILYTDDVLRTLMSSQAAVSVVVDLEWKAYFAKRFDDPYADAESLVLAGNGSITSIGQRDPTVEDVQAQYIGLIKFDRGGLDAIRQIRDQAAIDDSLIGWGRPWRKAFMTDLLQELVNRGTEVRAVPIRGGWCEIDSLRDHEIAEQSIASFATSGR
jgi:choline kinase